MLPASKGFSAFTFKADPPSRLSALITQATIRPAASLGSSSLPGIECMAIWDTGAMMTSISDELAKRLRLQPISRVAVHAAGNSYDSPVYKIDVILPNQVIVVDVSVSEAKNIRGAEMLIGMDIIAIGDFAVTNAGGHTFFSFRFPPCDLHIDFVQDVEKVKKEREHAQMMRKFQRKGKLR